MVSFFKARHVFCQHFCAVILFSSRFTLELTIVIFLVGLINGIYSLFFETFAPNQKYTHRHMQPDCFSIKMVFSIW